MGAAPRADPQAAPSSSWASQHPPNIAQTRAQPSTHLARLLHVRLVLARVALLQRLELARVALLGRSQLVAQAGQLLLGVLLGGGWGGQRREAAWVWQVLALACWQALLGSCHSGPPAGRHTHHPCRTRLDPASSCAFCSCSAMHAAFSFSAASKARRSSCLGGAQVQGRAAYGLAWPVSTSAHRPAQSSTHKPSPIPSADAPWPLPRPPAPRPWPPAPRRTPQPPPPARPPWPPALPGPPPACGGCQAGKEHAEVGQEGSGQQGVCWVQLRRRPHQRPAAAPSPPHQGALVSPPTLSVSAALRTLTSSLDSEAAVPWNVFSSCSTPACRRLRGQVGSVCGLGAGAQLAHPSPVQHPAPAATPFSPWRSWSPPARPARRPAQCSAAQPGRWSRPGALPGRRAR